MEISIIVPTRNRFDELMTFLEKLNKQTYDLSNSEVIILDDHSKINPKKAVSKLKTKYKIKIFRNEKHSGSGPTRNAAMKKVTGKYVFFLGDDMFPKEDLIEEHMKLHKKYKGIAVLGHVVWHPKLKNEFLDFADGIQFHFKNIKNPNNVKLHFYTSNISLESYWIKDEEYDQRMSGYGFEDIEFGHRLEQKGLRVVYNPKALVYHYHPQDFEDFCNRMINVGKAAVIFARIHPKLKRKLNLYPGITFLKPVAKVFSHKFFKKINKKFYWYMNFVYYFLVGVEREQRL